MLKYRNWDNFDLVRSISFEMLLKFALSPPKLNDGSTSISKFNDTWLNY